MADVHAPGFGAPPGEGERDAQRDGVLLDVRNLKKFFPVDRGVLFKKKIGDIKAVDGVSFSISRGETLGLVGESGCGKTTIGRCLMRLEEPTSGDIFFEGRNIATLGKKEMFKVRRHMQAVFQDPYSSLNPRMTIGEIVGEPFVVHGLLRGRRNISAKVGSLLDICGLPARLIDRYPHEMSGGQRQRVGIARALALNPSFILCDEAVSALDVSIQAQIIRLLEDLRAEFGLTYLFIGHDLSVVRHICHRVAVMYLGNLVELADTDTLFDAPLHPYTQALLSAVPVPDPDVESRRPHHVIKGEIPSPLDPPSGCVFHPRCPRADARCREKIPPARNLGRAHHVACFKAGPCDDSDARLCTPASEAGV